METNPQQNKQPQPQVQPGLPDTQFLGLLNNLNTGFQQNNVLVDQKNAVLDALMGNPVDPNNLSKLPPDIQKVIQGGNRDQMMMQAHILNDAITNKGASVASSIGYLTSGYENAVKTANDQKQAAFDNLIKIAQNFVDPKTGQVDIQRAGAALQGLYPGVDMSGIVSQLQGLMPTSEYNKYIYQGSGPNGSGTVTGGLSDPVSAAMSAIVGNEGSGAYDQVSKPLPSGKRSYGKYQVLDSNISQWTAEATGKSMTPQEFLADPAAQDAVAKWQIGNYWNKYGNIADVASMWFTGMPAAKSKGLKDPTTGVTSEQYVQSAVAAFNKQQSAAFAATDPQVQAYVDGIKSGTITSIASVPAKYKNPVAMAMSAQGTSSPLGDRRYTLAANALVAPYEKLPEYTLTANALPYLLKIDAAMSVPGSVSDQELLDSFTKMSTAGGVITDAQVSVITGGRSLADSVDVWKKKTAEGGVLSDDQRQQIYKLANITYGNLKKGYQPIYDKATFQLKASQIPQEFWTLPDLNTLSALSEQAVTGTVSGTAASPTSSGGGSSYQGFTLPY